MVISPGTPDKPPLMSEIQFKTNQADPGQTHGVCWGVTCAGDSGICGCHVSDKPSEKSFWLPDPCERHKFWKPLICAHCSRQRWGSDSRPRYGTDIFAVRILPSSMVHESGLRALEPIREPNDGCKSLQGRDRGLA